MLLCLQAKENREPNTHGDIPAGGTASFIRDVEISEAGNFQFTATCKDQLDQTLTFSSNQIHIDHVDPTPVVTDTPLATPLAPSVAPMPTDQPEPEWLDQAESIAEGIKWILTGIAAVLLVLLLILRSLLLLLLLCVSWLVLDLVKLRSQSLVVLA